GSWGSGGGGLGGGWGAGSGRVGGRGRGSGSPRRERAPGRVGGAARLVGDLARIGAVGRHGPQLLLPAPRRAEQDEPAVGGPGRLLVGAFALGEARDLPGLHVHRVKVEDALFVPSREGDQVS